MKVYLAAAALIIMLSGCQNTVAPTTATQQQGATASIRITRTQEEKVGTEEVNN